MRKKWMFIAPLALLGMVLFTYIGGEVVLRLWNWLMPPLFGWHQVTFWQALGLLVLCRILFGGFGLHGRGRNGMRRRMAERWDRMTPEERERFRERMSPEQRERFREGRERCGFGPAPGGSEGK
jgi:uncharacterized membrane protein